MGSMPSLVSEGPASFSADTVQEPTRSAGRKEVEEELLGMTRAVHIKHRTELSTLLGMGSSLRTRSTKSEGEGGSPSPTKGNGFSLAENGHKEQPKEMVHQDPSTPGKETGHPAHTSPVRNVHAETMSSSYRAFASRISRNRATSSQVAELEEETVGFAHIATLHGMVGEALESSDGHKVSGPPSRWSPHGRKQDATHTLGHGLPPSKEVLPLVSAEAPGGTPSVPWFGITGHLAASRQKEGTNSWGSPAGPSLGEEPFSPAPAHRARKRHRKVTYAKHTPLDSVFIKAERHTPDAHVEAPSQMPTLEDWTSPVMKSDQVTPPMEETHLPRLPSPKTDGLRSRVSGLQSSRRDVYSSTAFSVTWAPSGDQQREETEQAIEAASTARGEKPTAGQRTSWIHEEEPGTRPSKETKTHGKVSLWRLVSKESWRSPVPTQHGHWVAGNQSARSPTFITGEGQSQRQTQSPFRLGTTVSLRQRSSFPGTRLPLREDTTKRKVSLHAQPKTGAIHGERQRGETKECSSASEGKPLTVTDMGASLSWVSGSNILKEPEGTGHYTGVPKGEASPASLSQLPSQKRTQENSFSQGAHLSASAGPSHFSILSVLRNPASTSASDSSPFLGTEWMMKSKSPAPPSLQLDPGKTLGSTPNVTILLAEGRPTQVTPGRNGGQSTIQPETLSRVPTEEADLSLSPSSLEFAKLIGISERSSGSHHRMGFSPSPGKAVTVASYLTGAFPLEFRASQSNAPIGSKEAPNAISRKRGVSAGTLASVGRHRVLSGGASILGSYEVHTGKATPPLLRHQSQTEIEPLEEIMWETSGPKGTKPILEKKGGSLIPKTGRYDAEIRTAATHTGVEAKGSRQAGFGAPILASRQWPQSTYSNSTEETEKLATVPEEKASTENTVGLTNKPRWIPVSDTEMTEAASSVLGVQESPGTDKVQRLFPLEVNSENMHLGDTVPMAEAAVTL
ncbi:hypothetical protein JRQ81_011172 [Phrynocephalus forsythii]|uniref:Uncharacterized protein n=1 Tax=Phrynocephalus forsythii TaxID=171643 RepID=A0A9Q0X7K9_9SAUR|nr:hypothetical protein JRQ81_011172 [Phrynocephalus forsythii]